MPSLATGPFPGAANNSAYPLSEMVAAKERLLSREIFGKVIVNPQAALRSPYPVLALPPSPPITTCLGEKMFGKIHHVSYLVEDLNAAISSYVDMCQGEKTGQGHVAGLGEVGFVQVGEVEVEFIEPDDKSQLTPGGGHVFHHVAYVVENLDRFVADLGERGYGFLTPEPFTNFMGYRLIYIDPSHTGGTRVHLTEASSLMR